MQNDAEDQKEGAFKSWAYLRTSLIAGHGNEKWCHFLSITYSSVVFLISIDLEHFDLDPVYGCKSLSNKLL